MKTSLGKILIGAALLAALCCGGILTACGIGEHTHTFGAWQEVVPAQCEVNGLKRRVCTVQGCNKAEEEDISALGHDWGTSKVTVEATCEHGGERTRTCSRCQATETEQTDPTDHNWETYEVLKEAACEVGGRERQICSDCNTERTVDTPPLDHDWGDPEIVSPVTCEDAGLEVKTCRRPGCNAREEKELPAMQHQWRNAEVLSPATCEKAGEQKQVCNRPGCGQEQTVPIGALGHAWQGYYTVDEQATFDHAGSKSYHCSRCDKKQGEVTIPKLDKNTPIEYEFRTLRNNGELLSVPTMTIVVKDGDGQTVAQSTPATMNGGVFKADLLPKSYTVTVENAPDGYSCPSAYSVTPFDPYCNVYLTASLREGTPARYTEGAVMYDFTVPAANSTAGEIKLSELLQSKKMVLLNFWYVGCTYCEEEFPGVQRTYVKYMDSAEVIAINCPQSGQAGTLQEMRDYAGSLGVKLTFPLVQNAAVRLSAPFGVNSYPTTVVIDREGVVCEILVNYTSEAEFERIFAKYTSDDYLVERAPAAAAEIMRTEAILPSKRKTA